MARWHSRTGVIQTGWARLGRSRTGDTYSGTYSHTGVIADARPGPRATQTACPSAWPVLALVPSQSISLDNRQTPSQHRDRLAGAIPDTRGRRRAIAPARSSTTRSARCAPVVGRHSSPTTSDHQRGRSVRRQLQSKGLGWRGYAQRCGAAPFISPAAFAPRGRRDPTRPRPLPSLHAPSTTRCASLSRVRSAGLWTVDRGRVPRQARPRGWEVCSSSWPVVVVGSSAIL